MSFFSGLFGGFGGLLGKKKDKDKDKFKGMTDAQLKKSAISLRDKLVDDYHLPKLSVEEFRKRKGLVGLENMGNTCYINSPLQCLSNCEDLTRYFLTGEWEKDVNIPNILGSEGKIAAEYAKVLHNLWAERGSRVFEPKYFKYTLQKENSLFEGESQHDAQEFLAYMLDILHEDLNQVLRKPQIAPEPDYDDTTPEETYFQRCEAYYKAFNQSIIHDLFYGRFRSATQCPSCSHLSLKYEPFNMLTLPLKPQVSKEFDFFFMHEYFLYSVTRFTTAALAEDTLASFKQAIAVKKGIPAESMAFFEYLKSSCTFSVVPKEAESITVWEYLKRKKEGTFCFLIQLITPALPAAEDPVTIYFNVSHVKPEDMAGVYKVTMANKKTKVRDLYLHYFYCLKARFPSYITDPFWVYFQEDDKRLFDLATDDKLIPFVEPRPVSQQQHSAKTEPQSTAAKGRAPPQVQDSSEEEEDEVPQAPTHKTNAPADDADPNTQMQQPDAEDNAQNTAEEDFDLSTAATNPAEDLSNPAQKVADTPVQPGFLLLEDRQEITVHIRDKLVLRNEVFCNLRIDKDALATRSISIYDCLDLFTQQESLDQHNKWLCSKCKEHRQAKVELKIKVLPPILIIHLKRFSSTPQGGFSKNQSVVDFPLEDFNLSKYTTDSKPAKYSLFATVSHYGTLTKGHYVAFAKTNHGKVWVQFDDDELKNVQDMSEFANNKPYLLFYRREPN